MREYLREENSIFGREYKFIYSRGENATWLPFAMGFRVSDVTVISYAAYTAQSSKFRFYYLIYFNSTRLIV
ncbi:hypothetical protein EFM34_07305 [Leuconostoc suionicum]|nr:hypothetical protein [Leuconostoc suionicum]